MRARSLAPAGHAVGTVAAFDQVALAVVELSMQLK
jgi:hypothetical protein